MLDMPLANHYLNLPQKLKQYDLLTIKKSKSDTANKFLVKASVGTKWL